MITPQECQLCHATPAEGVTLVVRATAFPTADGGREIRTDSCCRNGADCNARQRRRAHEAQEQKVVALRAVAAARRQLRRDAKKPA